MLYLDIGAGLFIHNPLSTARPQAGWPDHRSELYAGARMQGTEDVHLCSACGSIWH